MVIKHVAPFVYCGVCGCMCACVGVCDVCACMACACACVCGCGCGWVRVCVCMCVPTIEPKSVCVEDLVCTQQLSGNGNMA